MLAAGSRLGPYEILSPLGAGGMGEVYRAHDPRLGREVAVKVLPAAVGADPERLRRFEQEARAASALNHPNILTVFDTGTQDGTAYLVTELLEGETVRGRLAGGALPVRRAVEITLHVARGLAAAHDRGIVHRDVKPENLFLTRDGRLKILDFGLAKLQGGHGSASELTAAPTALPRTAPGMVMGTVGYMAPEQVLGLPADHRSDIFALGAILYELLTGRRAFQAESAVETMSAILKEEPPELERLHEELAPGLARIVRHCLEKAPEQRFQSAGDLAFDLEALASGEAALSSRSIATRARAVRRRPLALAAAAAAALLLAAGGIWWALRQRGAAAAVSSTRLAVLPFTIRGGPGLAYLREGLVDLLSTKLDGAGELRTVDPHALLRAAEESGGEIDGPSGAELARRFGAGLHVVGSLVAVGDRLQLAATLYEGERAVGSAEASGRGEGEVLRLVDDLARQIVAGRFAAPEARIARLGALTTDSLPAVKAYLAGEKLLRGGEMAAAAEAFQQAVAADPNFALAHYRLALAAGWGEEHEESRQAAERAVALAASLPERDRQLLAALHAYTSGAADEAEELYRRILGRYPDDVEGWYGLGEVLWHHNPARGRPIAEARVAFARALALDPAFQPALFHLAGVFALQPRPAALDGPSARFLALYPDSDTAIQMRTWRAFLLGSEADRESLVAQAIAAGSNEPQLISNVVLFDLRQLARGERIVERAHAAAALPAADYHRAKIGLELARGRPSAARPHLAARARLLKEPSGILLRFPFLPLRREDWLAVRDQMAAWQAPAEWSWREHARHAGIVKAFSIGLADARLGEAQGVRQAIAALGRFEAPEDAPLARALAATLRAHLAAGAGRKEEALGELEAITLEAPAGLLSASPFYHLLHARQLRADLLFELGRWEEAIAWYRSLDEACCVDSLGQAAYSHLRRAEAFERLGRPRDAAWHYAHFLALWRDPDPELRPIVRRAQERLRRLNERT